MAKALSLIGNKYGKLTVISRVENTNKGNTRWLCKCDCGKTKIALGYDLTHGRTTSCGCFRGNPGSVSPTRQDLAGKKFGKLTVLKLNEEQTHNGIVVWDCVCECGNKTSVRAGNLRTGSTISCGHHCNRTKPAHYKDLVGNRYGKLIVAERVANVKGKTAWLCKCDCGNTRIVTSSSLKFRNVTSCGCSIKKTKYVKLLGENIDVDIYKLYGKRLYTEWYSMKQRCKKHYHDAKSYYEKNITICDEWLGDSGFVNFYNWAIENGYNNNLTLDRIDNAKGYSPDNCRWADWKIQQNNKTTNALVEYNGEVKTVSQWCDYFNLNYRMVLARRRRGIEPPKLFDPPHINQYK